MFKFLLKYPMLTSAALGFASIFVCFYFEAFSFTLCVLFIILIFVLFSLRRSPQIIFSLICVLLICTAALTKLDAIHSLNELAGKEIIGDFIITEVPEKNDMNFYTATLKVKNASELKNGTKILASLNSQKCKALQMGDIIVGKAKLKSINSWNSKLHYYSLDTYLSANVNEYTVTKTGGDPLYSFIGTTRTYINDYLFDNLSDNEASTLLALTVGDRSYMSDFFYGCVKSSGVAHVMVVSGMHLAIVMGFTTALSEKFFYNRIIKAIIIFAAVFFMTAICGFTVSIIRAGVTYIFIGISYLVKRRHTPANSLGAAVTLILILSPFTVFNLAFQLSVLSTYGVIALAPALSNSFRYHFSLKNKFLITITDSISVTLCAMIMTLPVVIYRFGYISVVGILTNLLISSAVTFALVLCITALILNLALPFLAPAFLLISGILTKYINSVIVTLGTMPFATVNIPPDLFWLGILIILLCLVLLATCNYRLRVLKLNKLSSKIIKETEGDSKWQQFMKKR